MNKKEVTEIKKLFTKERCCLNRLCGCYVDAEAVVQDEMQQLKEQEQQLNAEVAKLKQVQRHLQEAEEETEKLETQYKAAQCRGGKCSI